MLRAGEGMDVTCAHRRANRDLCFRFVGTYSGGVKSGDISGLSSYVKPFHISYMLYIKNNEKFLRVLLHCLRNCGCDGIPSGLKTCIPCPSGRIPRLRYFGHIAKQSAQYGYGIHINPYNIFAVTAGTTIC